MNKEHYSELITLSQEIYNDINKKLTAYLDKTYGSIPENTMAQQMEDYLFVAEESTGYVLGNALALVDAESMELEISTFENNFPFLCQPLFQLLLQQFFIRQVQLILCRVDICILWKRQFHHCIVFILAEQDTDCGILILGFLIAVIVVHIHLHLSEVFVCQLLHL